MRMYCYGQKTSAYSGGRFYLISQGYICGRKYVIYVNSSSEYLNRM